MTIKHKLLLPVGAQCLIFLLAVYFMMSTHDLFTEILQSREDFNIVSCKIRSLTYKIGNFYHKAISYEDLADEFRAVIELLRQRTHFSGQDNIIRELEALQGEHASLGELFERNQRVFDQIEELANFSFQQSNQYIESTIEKSLQESPVLSISPIERSMILSANLNNISNFTIKLLLRQMEKDLKASQDLLKHLDSNIRNAETAEKKLAGTTFAELPQKAKTANQQMKGLVQLYLENSRQLSETQEIAAKTLDLFLNNLSERETASLNILSDRVARLFWKLGMVLLCLTIVFMLVNLSLYRSLAQSFSNIGSVADAIASGDLTTEIISSGKNEIAALMKRLGAMMRHLNALIGKIQHSGAQISSSAMQLSATAREQDSTMASHLESMGQILEAVGDISSVMAQLVETIAKVSLMSKETAESANRGQADLAQMEAAVGHMESASRSISSRLETINEKAKNITGVVVTITKVAEQTNLLSLNAAIEAEKAGQFGRGFTVVAREIRRLADQTAAATLDIESMVHEMQTAVSSGMTEMERFIDDVQRSAGIVGKVSTQLTRIIAQIQALAPSFEQVNVAIGRQSANTRDINTTVVLLSEELKETREAFRETYSAIEQLNEISRELQNEVSRFSVSNDDI